MSNNCPGLNAFNFQIGHYFCEYNVVEIKVYYGASFNISRIILQVKLSVDGRASIAEHLNAL